MNLKQSTHTPSPRSCVLAEDTCVQGRLLRASERETGKGRGMGGFRDKGSFIRTLTYFIENKRGPCVDNRSVRKTKDFNNSTMSTGGIEYNLHFRSLLFLGRCNRHIYSFSDSSHEAQLKRTDLTDKTSMGLGGGQMSWGLQDPRDNTGVSYLLLYLLYTPHMVCRRSQQPGSIKGPRPQQPSLPMQRN